MESINDPKDSDKWFEISGHFFFLQKTLGKIKKDFLVYLCTIIFFILFSGKVKRLKKVKFVMGILMALYNKGK